MNEVFSGDGLFCRGELLVSERVPSWKLTYPTWAKGKSSSKVPFWGDMLIPWRVYQCISTDCFDWLFLTWRIRVLYQTVSNKTWLATVRMFQTHGSTPSHTDIKPSQNWQNNTQVTLNKHHHCSECAQLSLRWEKPRVKGRILFQDSQIRGTNLI